MTWVARAILVTSGALSGFFLILLGVERVADGRARDAAIPVPIAMMTGRSLPQGAYANAAIALNSANANDGEAAIFRAEALTHLSSLDETELLQKGLNRAPALVRGWALLALNAAKVNRLRAADALTQALVLAPKDYWVAGMRAQAAAILWDNLSDDAKDAAMNQTKLLWDEPSLRPRLVELLSSPGGPALVTKAFAARRDDLVSINRWVAAQARLSRN